jgi:hypothetical protein
VPPRATPRYVTASQRHSVTVSLHGEHHGAPCTGASPCAPPRPGARAGSSVSTTRRRPAMKPSTEGNAGVPFCSPQGPPDAGTPREGATRRSAVAPRWRGSSSENYRSSGARTGFILSSAFGSYLHRAFHSVDQLCSIRYSSIQSVAGAIHGCDSQGHAGRAADQIQSGGLVAPFHAQRGGAGCAGSRPVQRAYLSIWRGSRPAGGAAATL